MLSSCQYLWGVADALWEKCLFFNIHRLQQGPGLAWQHSSRRLGG